MIWNKCISLKGISFKNINLNWIDFQNIITIILDNDTEIPINEFDKNIHQFKFCKLKNIYDRCDHDIILNGDIFLDTPKMQWSIYKYKDGISNDYDASECLNEQEYRYAGKNLTLTLMNDYNGYEHTYNNTDIMNNNRDMNKYPAFNYCMSLNKKYPGYECYLPSMGELIALYNNSFLINYMLIGVGLTRLLMKQVYWSSTEDSAFQAWTLNDGINFPKNKTYDFNILPLFKKIK